MIELYWKKSPVEVEWFRPYLDRFEWRQYDPAERPDRQRLDTRPQGEPPITRDLEALLAEALTRPQTEIQLIED